MKKLLIILVLLNAIVIFIACEDVEVISNTELPVVTAYLQTNKQFDYIKVEQVNPYISDSLANFAINDLNIALVHSENNFILESTGGDSGYYYYPGNDLVFEVNNSYSLEFEYKGDLITAETICPDFPVNMALSGSTIEIERPYDGDPIGYSLGTIFFTLTWDNDDGKFHYVTVSAIDEASDTITSYYGESSSTFSSIPIEGDFFDITMRDIRFYGRHRVVLYRINQEFADLFENTGQGSMTLAEPISNISNGRGIFTGISSDTLFFDVIEK